MKIILLFALLRTASSLLVDSGRTFAVRGHPQIVSGTPPLSMAAAADDETGGSGGVSSSSSSNANNNLDRRTLLSVTSRLLPAAAVFSAVTPALAEGGKGKVVVFGGSGYVGSYVGKILSDGGYEVVSVSRSSAADQSDRLGRILGNPVPTISYVSLDAATADLGPVLEGAAAVVSCVGIAPGGPNQREGNGAVNVRIADAAKAAGVGRFVYISVASALANGPAKFLLGDYLKGKAEAEAAVVRDFGGDASLVVKPAIIAGGPPGEMRPPGPPGVKPASVEAVAKAVVAGVVGDRSGIIDGNDAISAL